MENSWHSKVIVAKRRSVDLQTMVWTPNTSQISDIWRLTSDLFRDSRTYGRLRKRACEYNPLWRKSIL